MKIKKLLGLILAINALSLSACTRKIGWISSNMPRSTEASYTTFTGEEFRQFNAESGDRITLNFQSRVTKGDLDLKILDPEKEVIKDLAANKIGKYSFEAEETGNYWILITGENTGGSYQIMWDAESEI